MCLNHAALTVLNCISWGFYGSLTKAKYASFEQVFCNFVGSSHLLESESIPEDNVSPTLVCSPEICCLF